MESQRSLENPSKAVDARVAKSRDKLRAALLGLLSAHKLADITVANIADRAGVGYATFFRHYAGKLELWHDITDGLTDELLARVAPIVDDPDTMRVAREFCAFVEANRNELGAILGQGGEGDVREDLVRRSAALVKKKGLRRSYGLPRDLATLHAINASIGIAGWWLEHGGSVSTEEMTKIIYRLVIRPLREDGPRV